MPVDSARRSARPAFAHGLLVAAALMVAACGPTASPAGPGGAGTAQPGGTPKGKVIIALVKEPDQLRPKFGPSSRGLDKEWIFDTPLTYYDIQNAVQPLMAEQVPTPDNRGWVINADGTMVTTYRLRENVRWHDGVLLTAHDFVFAYGVIMDPEIIINSRDPMPLMSAVEAPDDRTLMITWSKPYLQANQLGFGMPALPRHRLEEEYRTDKAHFPVGVQATSDYVGSGPFRLESWEPGVRIVARAYRDWFWGPPRIEVLEIRFISDPSTLLANLLAGEVDFAAYPAIRLSEVEAAREWVARGEGYVKAWAKRIKYIEFQYREIPNWQRAVTDVRVRQALTHAIDRDALADVMTDGLGQKAEAWVLPSDPLFPPIDRAITKYPFDPQRAMALLANAGWRMGPGGLLANAAGEALDMEVNSGSSEPQIATIAGDAWKRLGINANVHILPVALQQDQEFRASFLATHIGERTVTGNGGSLILLSSLIPAPPVPPTQNRGAFSDVEVDRLYTVAVTSFDPNVRREAVIAMNQRLSELAAYGPLYYGVDVLLARSRLTGPVGESVDASGSTWNIFEWEVID